MDEYLDLSRRFALITDYTTEALFASSHLEKRLTWDDVLDGRYSVVVGRANLGKTTELKAKCVAMRNEGLSALFVPLHRILGEENFEDSLEAEDCDVLAAWKAHGGKLTVFVDSLDEASLGTEGGIRKALRRLSSALNWPNSDVRWVLSSRPAVLTDDVLKQLQTALRTTLYKGDGGGGSDEDQSNSGFIASEANITTPLGAIGSADSVSKTESRVSAFEQLKLYALTTLDRAGAQSYLQNRLAIDHAGEMLTATKRYGLARLSESPGGLDILAYIDPVRQPPQSLAQAFEKIVEAVQQQQRSDPREQRVGNPPPESLDEAIGRLAGASVICQLPNIEISSKALHYREGVLSARPIIASILSEPSLEYLLGSRLFIDSGHYQVKLYPDELLPYLAAKRLAKLVKSPDHARRLMANFTWQATTGECGVHRALLPLAGWLAVFNKNCRQEILHIEPQAVAFFGDLRHPEIKIHEAAEALDKTLERLQLDGDFLGRSYYTLTAENYWQAAKPGMESVFRELINKYGGDWHARNALLDIASHAGLDVFREIILDSHDHDYSRLIDEPIDLNYILALSNEFDLLALSASLKSRSDLSEQRVAQLLVELAWKSLDAASVADLSASYLLNGKAGFSISWALTREIAQSATDVNLYRMARSLLLRLARNSKGDAEWFWSSQKFVEIVSELLAITIQRQSIEASRSASLCLVLNRLIYKKYYGSADVSKLRESIKKDTKVRLSLLHGLIHPTNKSADAIWSAVFSYASLYEYFEGDESALDEPGFTEVITERKKAIANSAAKQNKPAKRAKDRHSVDQKSKTTLLGMLDSLRDASEEGALAWVAQWLAHTAGTARYGECNFELFEIAAGKKISKAVREGLSVLWRKNEPLWNEEEQNSTYNITIAGLHGLHLDLGDGSQLPVLSEQEVRRAIQYARFEINGYPQWFWSLVETNEAVAVNELSKILENSAYGPVSFAKAEELIRQLSYAPANIRQELSSVVWDFTAKNQDLSEYTSEAALKVVAANGDVIDRATFEAEAWRRMNDAFALEPPEYVEPPSALTSQDHEERQKLEKMSREIQRQRANAVVWGTFWLWNYPSTFTEHWEEWERYSPEQAERFMLALAEHLGDDRSDRLKLVAEKGSIGLNTLQKLYQWVSSVVRFEDDLTHEGMYSPSERDHAQRFRDSIIPAIAHVKSEHAYQVLEVLRAQAMGPKAKYLRRLQFLMREEQFSKKVIAQREYLEFERTFAPPISTYDDFAMAVETDILDVKHQIEKGDFSLRRFFNSISFSRIKTDNDGFALEEDFQALLGSELNHASGNRYSVTLEPILPEGTRRDVLCQSGSLRATIELKMSFRWTLDDYIEALESQLHGQYMMAPESKIGFFVVVLQKDRAWRGPDGKNINFGNMLKILKEKARQKEIEDSSVYLRVIGIDATPKENFRSLRKTETTTKASASEIYTNGLGKSWSGRGRMPKWLRDALAAGGNLEEFLTPTLTG